MAALCLSLNFFFASHEGWSGFESRFAEAALPLCSHPESCCLGRIEASTSLRPAPPLFKGRSEETFLLDQRFRPRSASAVVFEAASFFLWLAFRPYFFSQIALRAL